MIVSGADEGEGVAEPEASQQRGSGGAGRPDGRSPRDAARAQAYWRANLRLIALLLGVWALVSYGLGIVLVEPLNRLHLGGFPLGFWFAQQGAIYVFIALVIVYAVAMDRIDRRHGVDGEEPGQAPAAEDEAGAPEAPAEAHR